MASHDLTKFVDANGDEFNVRDTTKQPVADRVTSIRAASSATDTNYPTEKAVRTELDKMAPGAITTDVTIANGDKMIISDASDSSKMKRASAAFDGSTTKKFLNQKGTFTQVLEADLEWGGDFRTSKSPSEAYTRQNLWFNPKSSAVYVEYCTDRTSANPTWLPYGETDTDKLKLFSGAEDTAAAFYCGKNTHIQPGYTGSISGTKDLTSEIVPDQGLRITICCRSLASRDADVDIWSYGLIVRVLMNINTNSAAGGPRHCVVETMTGANFKADNDTWVNRGDFNISGDSGWNSIPLQVTFGGGWTQTSQVWVVRFTLWAEALNANPASSQTGNLKINTIAALTKTTWSPDTMKRFGTPYSVTETGVAVFKDIKFNARKLKTNLARTADSTFDGSADQLNIPVTGTLPVGNGGTGKSSVTSGNYLVGNGTSALVEKTPKDVGSDVLSSLDDKSNASSYANFVDSDFVVGSDHVDASTISASTFVRRTALNLWNYIKSKLTGSDVNIGGNAATAGTADTAKAFDGSFTGTNSIAYALGLKQNLIAWDANADTYNASTNRAATVDSIVKRIAVKPDGFSASVDYTKAVELSIPYSAGPGRVALMCVATTGNGDTVSFQATFVKVSNEKMKFVVGTIMASTGTFVSPVLKFLSSDDSSPAQKVVLYIDANVRCNLSCLVAANDGMSSITVTEVERSTADNYSPLSSWGRLANDSGVVHLDGSETITGAKEFSRSGQDTNFTDSSGAESIVRARTATNSNNGSCQIDAYAGGGKFGVYARNASGTGKWVACLDNDGVVNLGSSGDAVRIGGTKFVFGASQLGTDSNTFYWV